MVTSTPKIFTVCRSMEFKCNNGRCINSTWKCNGVNDCIDNTDEKDCPGIVSNYISLLLYGAISIINGAAWSIKFRPTGVILTHERKY